MSQQKQFTLAVGILFPLAHSAQQNCWRAVKALPEPHLSELIAALTRGAAQRIEATRQDAAAITAAIGRTGAP